MPRSEATQAARDLLEQVGLKPDLFALALSARAVRRAEAARQHRARAGAEPRLLILDEAVSALDKSVEAQVLNLLRDLKRQLQPDLPVHLARSQRGAVHLSDRVLVMYLGQVVEIGPVDAIYAAPGIPTRRRCSARGSSWIRDDRVDEAPLTGDPPNPINPPSGCRFRTRCSVRRGRVRAKMPAIGTGSPRSHLVACHMADASSGTAAPACAVAWPPSAACSGRMRDALQPRPRQTELRRCRRSCEVDDLTVKFVSREATVQAVNGVSFEWRRARCCASSANPARARA